MHATLVLYLLNSFWSERKETLERDARVNMREESCLPRRLLNQLFVRSVSRFARPRLISFHGERNRGTPLLIYELGPSYLMDFLIVSKIMLRYPRSSIPRSQRLLSLELKRFERDIQSNRYRRDTLRTEDFKPISTRNARYIRIGNVAYWICVIHGILCVVSDHWPISSSTSYFFRFYVSIIHSFKCRWIFYRFLIGTEYYDRQLTLSHSVSRTNNIVL